MSSIEPSVYELKEADGRAWFRVIYLSKIENRIYVLHSFEKESRKTDGETSQSRVSASNSSDSD
jgi:phage-related protein